MKVASTVDDGQAFTARAREAAEALGARAIGATERFLYTPPAVRRQLREILSSAR